MAKQAESNLSRAIIKSLRSSFPGSWWVKTSGNNRVGTPDIIGCVEGMFVAIETKMPTRENTVTKIQQATLDAISYAGGLAVVVTGVHQAQQAVEEALAALAALRGEPRT